MKKFHTVVFRSDLDEVVVFYYRKAHTHAELLSYIRRRAPWFLEDEEWRLVGFSNDRNGEPIEEVA